MRGGILYANGEPVADGHVFCLIGAMYRLHFKKSTKKFAVNGSFTAIIKFLASLKELEDYEYINFEEDMGIVGLKNAKSAYRPEFKLKKYHGEVFD